MTECPYIDQLERVATERANTQETLKVIDHISREGCEKCGKILKLLDAERLEEMACNKIFSSCAEFMARKKDFSSMLRTAIKPRTKNNSDDTNRQQ